jgi:hypothetical protein
MKVSRPNAIQWSTPIINSLKLKPISHPIAGMSIWNPPKNEANKIADFRLLVFTVIPLRLRQLKRPLLSLKQLRVPLAHPIFSPHGKMVQETVAPI